MLKRRIIPCLDVRDGRVVKGVHFRGLRDAGNPAEAARAYDEQGADELCVLDITATAEGRETFVDVVRAVSSQVFCPLTVGGGIRRASDVARLLDAGADKVAINSAAVMNPRLITEVASLYGSQCIVAAVDVRRMPPRGRTIPPAEAPDVPVAAGLHPATAPAGHELAPAPPATEALLAHEATEATSAAEATRAPSPAPDPDEPPVYEVVIQGGTRSTGLEALSWCRALAELGAGEILLTSMDRDGTREGYDLYITGEVSRAVPIPVIASGGVGDLEHLREGLDPGGGDADGALAASIFHFGLYTIAQAKQYLADHHIPVRPYTAPHTFLPK